jgi:dolichyl-phosphate-mannose--protein O-mannosyl transferase
MTLSEAMALQPAWIGIWLNILLVGAFIVPLALLIWKPSRLAAIFCIIAGVLGAVGVDAMYNEMGYVKLLGLPHVIVWTPLVIYLVRQIKRPDMPVWPKRIMMVILAVIAISLAFDYTDVIRYVLGERTPLALPPA